MKILFRKVVAIFTLMMAAIVPSQAYDSFSYTVLTLPDDPRVTDPWVKVISNQDDWEAFFYATTAAITYPVGMAPEAPVFDFEEYQVVSGGFGARPSGGYHLALESVDELEDQFLISVFDVSPSPTCSVSFAITYPSITILVKKTDKPVNISISGLTQQCGEE